MEDYIKEGLKKMVDENKSNPKNMEIADMMANASREPLIFIANIKKQDKKLSWFMLATFVSGLVMTSTDTIDEAMDVIDKAKEQIVNTEKEINMGGVK